MSLGIKIYIARADQWDLNTLNCWIRTEETKKKVWNIWLKTNTGWDDDIQSKENSLHFFSALGFPFIEASYKGGSDNLE